QSLRRSLLLAPTVLLAQLPRRSSTRRPAGNLRQTSPGDAKRSRADRAHNARQRSEPVRRVPQPPPPAANLRVYPGRRPPPAPPRRPARRPRRGRPFPVPPPPRRRRCPPPRPSPAPTRPFAPSDRRGVQDWGVTGSPYTDPPRPPLKSAALNRALVVPN